ncbi:hypothetical protein GCM10010515_25460 [Streptomyces fructofermentans]|uniref:N-acetyltransferase domain-containing protein n=1 Tax=Streptomyces fructofermentans TaxID=152141 RepID=A0A918KB77_9ACTN|nr:hypothetical protein GCM10010515_25460 [Streptomyces fructofermentans]
MDERTVAGWAQAEDVTARMLLEGERIVAYGELWFDAEEDEVELARIIVAPWARGTGLGRLLVAGLLKEARAAGHTDVFMRVHPANERALACYRAAGFVPVDRESAALWNVGQPVDYAWLRPGRDPEGDGR